HGLPRVRPGGQPAGLRGHPSTSACPGAKMTAVSQQVIGRSGSNMTKERASAILGISAFYHDSAAALVVDGDVVAAAQEERLTRKKYDAAFPSHAIDYCLEKAGLTPDQLGYVVFYDKPLTKFDRLLETYLGYAPRGFRSFATAMPVWLKRKLYLRRLIYRHLKGAKKVPLG